MQNNEKYPNNSLIINHSRNTDIGSAQTTDVYILFNLSEKMFRNKISSVFHSLRGDCLNKTVIFFANGKKVLSISATKELLREHNFSVTIYEIIKDIDNDIIGKPLKISDNNLRKLILRAYGFKTPPLTENWDEEDDYDDEEIDEYESANNESVSNNDFLDEDIYEDD